LRPEKSSKASFRAYVPLIFGIACWAYLTYVIRNPWLPSLAYAILVWQIVEFLAMLGTYVGIFNVITLLAAGQWVCIPVITNDFLGTNIMAVKEEDYLSFVIPGFFMLYLGINWFKGRWLGTERMLIAKASKQLAATPNLGLYLFFIGFLGGLTESIVPLQFRFFIYLLHQLMFVGAIYTILSPAKNKLLVVGFVILLTLSEVAATGMFGEFIFWTGLMIIVLGVNFRIPLFIKLLIFSIGVFLIFVIQVVKWEFRAQTWEKEVDNKGEILASVFFEKLSNPESLGSPDAIYGLLERGNMGFHIGKTLKHVPQYEPFAGGETILVATVGALIPRFIWSDKPKAGGSEMMRRFAGYKVRGTTSMDIGHLAEGYANFGKTGGWIYIFFYGLFWSWLFYKLMQKAIEYPTLIFWLPFIFIQAIKVETDLNSVLNPTIKSIFFVWLVFSASKRFFKVNL
jgi:hypothetical protein